MKQDEYIKEYWELMLNPSFSIKEESDRVQRLNDLWWKLTNEEQDFVEERLGPKDAPVSLNLVDVVASDGVSPRVIG